MLLNYYPVKIYLAEICTLTLICGHDETLMYDLLVPKLISSSVFQHALETKVWRKSIKAHRKYRGDKSKCFFAYFHAVTMTFEVLTAQSNQFITDQCAILTKVWLESINAYHRYCENNILDDALTDKQTEEWHKSIKNTMPQMFQFVLFCQCCSCLNFQPVDSFIARFTGDCRPSLSCVNRPWVNKVTHGLLRPTWRTSDVARRWHGSGLFGSGKDIEWWDRSNPGCQIVIFHVNRCFNNLPTVRYNCTAMKDREPCYYDRSTTVMWCWSSRTFYSAMIKSQNRVKSRQNFDALGLPNFGKTVEGATKFLSEFYKSGSTSNKFGDDWPSNLRR